MRRYLALLSALLVMSAACGGGDTDTPSTSATTATAQTQAAATTAATAAPTTAPEATTAESAATTAPPASTTSTTVALPEAGPTGTVNKPTTPQPDRRDSNLRH